jgi:L-ribulose-5-phosphate 3-epimerase
VIKALQIVMTEKAKIESNPSRKMAIGMMQGRLSPVQRGKIQSFPMETWQNEFQLCKSIGLSQIEWTIDTYKFLENPLVSLEGNLSINSFSEKFGLHIPSVTCDYFMEVWRGDEIEGELMNNLRMILQGMSQIQSNILVIPLVDESSLQRFKMQSLEIFEGLVDFLEEFKVRIAFELDLPPSEVRGALGSLDLDYFGINYDIGNSASLGFDPDEEFELYGDLIINVHVKDRFLDGPTCPLGHGAADFARVFLNLKTFKYGGNLILQTARDSSGDHLGAIIRYKRFVEDCLTN